MIPVIPLSSGLADVLVAATTDQEDNLVAEEGGSMASKTEVAADIYD